MLAKRLQVAEGGSIWFGRCETRIRSLRILARGAQLERIEDLFYERMLDRNPIKPFSALTNEQREFVTGLLADCTLCENKDNAPLSRIRQKEPAAQEVDVFAFGRRLNSILDDAKKQRTVLTTKQLSDLLVREFPYNKAPPNGWGNEYFLYLEYEYGHIAGFHDGRDLRKIGIAYGIQTNPPEEQAVQIEKIAERFTKIRRIAQYAGFFLEMRMCETILEAEFPANFSVEVDKREFVKRVKEMAKED